MCISCTRSIGSMDLKRRLSEGASIATKHRGPWKLIYYEAYVERADAEGRERYLKSGRGRLFLRRQLRHYLKKFPGQPATAANAFLAGEPHAPKAFGVYAGYPAWI